MKLRDNAVKNLKSELVEKKHFIENLTSTITKFNIERGDSAQFELTTFENSRENVYSDGRMERGKTYVEENKILPGFDGKGSFADDALCLDGNFSKPLRVE